MMLDVSSANSGSKVSGCVMTRPVHEARRACRMCGSGLTQQRSEGRACSAGAHNAWRGRRAGETRLTGEECGHAIFRSGQSLLCTECVRDKDCEEAATKGCRLKRGFHLVFACKGHLFRVCVLVREADDFARLCPGGESFEKCYNVTERYERRKKYHNLVHRTDDTNARTNSTDANQAS